MPVPMDTFLKHVQNSSKVAAEVLEHEWLADCSDMIDDMRDEVEAWMPQEKVGFCFVTLVLQATLIFKTF